MPLPPLPEPVSAWTRLWSAVRVSPPLALLFSSLLFINVVQVVSLILRPFSLRAFRRINRELAGLWWGLCVMEVRLVFGVKVIYTGDSPPQRENVMVVANHQEMTDIPILMFFARSKKRLGDMKWFVKKPLKWVPGVGWGMQFIDCIFVQRDWTRDAGTIERTFARIVKGKVPLWLISFSEGTRITAGKLAAAREYAEQKGAWIPAHVLLPRTKGFVASVQGLRGHIDAVYDVTIGYVGGVPSLWQYVRGLARTAHLHVRRFPIEDLPQGPQELADWLSERFREKDALLDGFYANGAFPGHSTVG